jgi:hypothetical protein
MLCYDVMELVGQEVSRCREVRMNIAKYDAVVRTMNDTFRESYGHQDARRSYYEEFGEYEHYWDNQSPDPDPHSSHDEHHETFISDFKDCIHELWTAPPELRGSNLDMCAKWSNGWGRYTRDIVNEAVILSHKRTHTRATRRGVIERYEMYGTINFELITN